LYFFTEEVMAIKDESGGVRFKPVCRECGEGFALRRFKAGYRVCLFCGEEAARAARKSWCVLTPHKQGPMFFTQETAREAAIGINNKGGLVK
jgi:ribosomal protein L37AE/L43A